MTFDKLNNWKDTFFKLEYNLTIIFWFAVVGIYLIFLANNSLTWLSVNPDKTQKLSKDTNVQGLVIGYSLIMMSLFGFLITKWALISKTNFGKKLSILSVLGNLGSSLHIMLLILAVGWMSSLQIRYKDFLTSIDKTRLPNNFNTYAGSFLTILILSVFLIYSTIESTISKNMVQDQQNKAFVSYLGENIDSVLYLFIFILYILLFIINYILNQQVTFG